MSVSVFPTPLSGIQEGIVNAKGDLIAATADNTLSRLAVGTDGQILTADSNEATGLKFATPAGGGFVGAAVTKNATQSITNATYVAIEYQVEDFDTDAFHSTSTNISRFTIPAGKAGKYLFTGTVTWKANTTGDRRIGIYKNGNGMLYPFQSKADQTDDTRGNFSCVLDLLVADYVETFAFQNSSVSLNLAGGANENQFSITFLGA